MIPDYTAAVVKVYHAPRGSYPAVVTGFKESVGKDSNAPMLVFDFKVDVGDGKTLERKMYCTMPIQMTASALGKIKQTCIALKVPPKVAIEANLVVGRECTANLVDGREYLGNKTSDIASIDPPGQATGAIATVDTTDPAIPVNSYDDVPF